MENKFLDTMMFRHACKEMDGDKKISQEEFDSVLEMGRLSPSSFGMEPWKFVVIQDESLREKLKSFTWGAQGTLPTSSHFVIILARKKSSMIHGSEYVNSMLDYKELPEDIKKMYGGFYEKFQKEDFNLLESDRTIFDWASKQTYIALANMMTGAAYMGIDSCPIEGFDAKSADEFIVNELGLDGEEFGVSVMCAFGYRKAEAKREKSRLPIESVTKWY
jgi:nitroreductase